MENSILAISKACDICKKFKKSPPRPVAALPLANRFNEAISMDLKYYDKVYFLVLVDLATRFCVAKVIPNKWPCTIISGIFTCWISLFGTPGKVLSDNGKEFDNAEFREMGEKFNIKILTTAAESPWSNGICERMNAVLGKSVDKIMAESRCGVEVALAWAVSARNALPNFSGFSSNQLVFGFNPAIPASFLNEPPANEFQINSEIVRQNLNAMHEARRNFIEMESCQRLKRALNHNIRETPFELLENGNQVYYKRNASDEWHGPGTVIGRDGKQVLVRHGGTFVRVHTCRLQGLSEFGDQGVANKLDLDVAENLPNQVNEYPPNEDEEFQNNDSAAHVDEVISSKDSEANIDKLSVRSKETANDSVSCGVRTSNDKNKLSVMRVGERFEGCHSRTGERFTGKILSRAGKASGKYKNCFNVQKDSDGSIDWFDFDKDFTEVIKIHDEEEVLVTTYSDTVQYAKEQEIQNWLTNEVFEEVENMGQKYISVRWVVTEKVKNGELTTKARLVARGFEEDTDIIRKDSPTCFKESVRLLVSIASAKDWECHSIDVKSAYLQGNEIEREVFLKPPKEFYTGKLWKLKKTVYGLNDAARAWYLRVKSELIKLGAVVSSLDPALFKWDSAGHFEGIVCIYVDDFLWAGSENFKDNVIGILEKRFVVGTSEVGSFKYIGLNIKSHHNGITIDQFKYANSLQPIDISRERSNLKFSELSEEEKEKYRSLIGQLNWLSTQTRPDIAFDVCNLCVSYKNARIQDLLRLNQVINRVRKEEFRIHFPRLHSLELCYLECFSDASFANLSDGGSQGGFIIILSDDRGNRCPLFWQSRKIRRVVKSTLSAETLALLECAETAIYLREIIAELTSYRNLKIVCYVDNKSLVEALYSTTSVEDKRLRIDIAVLSGMIERKELDEVKWVSSAKQLADCLTKTGSSSLYLRSIISA